MAPLFSSTKRRLKLWQEIAQEWDGEVLNHKGNSGKKRLHIFVDPHEIVIDTWTDGNGQLFTRFRCPFKNPNMLYFKLTHEYFFHEVMKYMGLQDIIIGDYEFDKAFLIKGNQSESVKWIFSDHAIQQKMMELKNVHFMIKADKGLFKNSDLRKDIGELYFSVSKNLRNRNEINKILDLFVLVLRRLHTKAILKSL